ncbi:hypothetical protein ASC87_02440 [Rhizobacter sp. Root1221]|nr:hypothetical protein ASC87_02440 [Rhizobacter sp. Root1221]
MGNPEFVGLFEVWAKYLVSIGGPLAASGTLYVFWRTGSAHLLRLRIWRLVHGKAALHDATVRRFIDERTSLMAFRYSAGISVRSLEGSRRLILWLEDHDEDIADVRAVGRHFDREQLALTGPLPRQGRLIRALAVWALFWSVCITVSSAWFLERGYFSLKEGGQRFSATTEEVRAAGIHFFAEPASLTVEQCRQPAPETGGFSVHDASVLCSVLLDSDFARHIAKALLLQRTGIGFLICIYAAGVVGALMKMRQAKKALEMADRLRRRERQMVLPFSF